jgi:hypothetical protein
MSIEKALMPNAQDLEVVENLEGLENPENPEKLEEPEDNFFIIFMHKNII